MTQPATSPAGEPLGGAGTPALPSWLLDVARCPACHGELAHAADGSTLTCGDCGRTYPVRDGVPVLLVDEATGGTDEGRV